MQCPMRGGVGRSSAASVPRLCLWGLPTRKRLRAARTRLNQASGYGRFSAGRETEDGTHDGEVQKDANK